MGTAKEEALAVWLDRAVDTPRAWGVHDCTLWPADWVVECGHADPADGWRGRYRTALGAARLAGRVGGLADLWRDGAAAAGLSLTVRPRAGDVGLLGMTTQGVGPRLAGLVGGICIGAGEWAVITPAGLWLGRASPVAAWRTAWRTR
ncbi:MAG: DUF6950 family protein [Brevundimonas sp.]